MTRGPMRFWAMLALATLVATACGGAGEPEAPAEDAGAEAVPAEADCEPGQADAVAAGRSLMDETAAAGAAMFDGSAEVCGLEAFAIEVPVPEEDPISANSAFTPSVLVGEPGQELTVRVTNRSLIAHTFTIDEQGIDERLLPATEPGGAGEPVEVTVTFPSGDQPVLIRCDFHGIGGHLGALVTS